MNGHHYIATSHLDELVSFGIVSLPEVDQICSSLREKYTFGGYRVDIGVYLTKHNYYILEGSDKVFDTLDNSMPRYPSQSAAALVAFCYKRESWDTKMIFGPDSSPNSFELEHMKAKYIVCCRELKQDSMFYCTEEHSMSMGLCLGVDFIGSIRITPKTTGKLSHCKLVNYAQSVKRFLNMRGFLASKSPARASDV